MKNNNIVEEDQKVLEGLDAYKLTLAHLAGIDTLKPKAVKAYFAAMARNKTVARLLVVVLRVELARLRSLYLKSNK